MPGVMPCARISGRWIAPARGERAPGPSAPGRPPKRPRPTAGRRCRASDRQPQVGLLQPANIVLDDILKVHAHRQASIGEAGGELERSFGRRARGLRQDRRGDSVVVEKGTLIRRGVPRPGKIGDPGPPPVRSGRLPVATSACPGRRRSMRSSLPASRRRMRRGSWWAELPAAAVPARLSVTFNAPATRVAISP